MDLVNPYCRDIWIYEFNRLWWQRGNTHSSLIHSSAWKQGTLSRQRTRLVGPQGEVLYTSIQRYDRSKKVKTFPYEARYLELSGFLPFFSLTMITESPSRAAGQDRWSERHDAPVINCQWLQIWACIHQASQSRSADLGLGPHLTIWSHSIYLSIRLSICLSV